MLRSNELVIDFEQLENDLKLAIAKNGLSSGKSDLSYSILNGVLRVDFGATVLIKQGKRLLIETNKG